MADKPAKKKQGFPFIPFLLSTALAAYICYHLIYVLTPFILSVALAYLCNPIISYFEVRGFKRSHAVVMFYFIIFGLLSIGGNELVPIADREWSLLQGRTPAYLARLHEAIGEAKVRIGSKLPIEAVFLDQFSESLYDTIFHHVRNLPSYAVSVLPYLSLLFLVPFITFFLLLDGHKSIERLIQACPSRYVEQALYLLSEIETSMGNYLRGLFIIVIAISVASFIGLVSLGVEHSLAIALLSGLSSVVPYLGAVIGAVVGGTAATYQFGSLFAGLKVVVLFTGIRLADEAFVQPIVSKHAVKLHPLLYLLSLMVGGELFGFVGLLFAVPFTCVLKALMSVWWAWYTTEGYLEGAGPLELAVVPYT